MIFWMSETAIGSMPANGSSSRMNFGEMTSARVISARRRSPARQRVGRRVRQRGEVQLREQLAQACAPGRASTSIVSRMARMFCSTVSPRKIEGSCGR